MGALAKRLARRRLSVTDSARRAPTAAASGEPMLLVHGITDTWRTWELLLPLLEPAPRHAWRSRCSATPAAARSATTGEVTLLELVDEAERDMDAAGFETAHLVGNSLGGWIVARAGRARPRALGRRRSPRPAAGTRATPGRSRATGSSSPAARSSTLTKPARAEPRSPRPAAALAGPRRPRLRPAGGPRLAGRARSIARRRRLPGGAAAADRVAGRTATRTSAEIDCPVRIVWGTKDMLLPLKHVSDRFRRLRPAGGVDRDPGRRAPAADRPPRATEVIREAASGSTVELRAASSDQQERRATALVRSLPGFSSCGHVPAVELQVHEPAAARARRGA